MKQGKKGPKIKINDTLKSDKEIYSLELLLFMRYTKWNCKSCNLKYKSYYFYNRKIPAYPNKHLIVFGIRKIYD